jgi:transcriptional regulator of acetoin/glycerol metabolism
MTPEQIEQDVIFLRSQVQRLSRLIDALESSPLLIHAVTAPEPEPEPETFCEIEIRSLAELEKEAILNARKIFGKNSYSACAALGIGHSTFYRKLRAYEVRK